MTATHPFRGDTAGLPAAEARTLHRLRDGERVGLEMAPVVKQVAGRAIRTMAYNGSVPGPTLHVDQGSEITVDVTNNGDVDTTVHWHGVRLASRCGGVAAETEPPIGVGATFSYRLRFPDPGFYWYHPHRREEHGRDVALYGTIIVEPADAAYWPRVDRQLAVTLDELRVGRGRMAPRRRLGPTFAGMRHSGTVPLVNGEERLDATVALGEVVRLHLVNTASTRPFNVAIPDARMKLVGGDSGRYQRETVVEEIPLAPSERAIVDVQFDRVGIVRLEDRTWSPVDELGSITVVAPDRAFGALRVDPQLTGIADALDADRARPPDTTLALRWTIPVNDGAAALGCRAWVSPMRPEPASPGIHEPRVPSNVASSLAVLDAGLENDGMSWRFGDRVKVRLVNERSADQAVDHPFHIHAGRFLILSRDGVADDNLVWKDSVLVASGQTVDILLDVTHED